MPPHDPRERIPAGQRVPAAQRIIVALDVESLSAAEAMMDRLEGVIARYKVGNQLFTAAGPAAVEAVQKRGAEVFLDLKFHDIPNTVAGAVREAARMGVFMFNVHASGGRAMMKAAADAAAAAARELKVRRPLAIAVTVLTSLDRAVLHRELGVAASVEGHVLRLCDLAREAGLDGCVASPQEIAPIRNGLGRDWVIVTPGVRPAGAELADQVRVATPGAAARAGAHFLVVGRPITGAPEPARAAEAIFKEVGAELGA
jgi:orotidine-5'-phosphate decarboxylase